MRETLARLFDSSTPAHCCRVAVLVSSPCFGVFWLANAFGLSSAEVALGIDCNALWALQAILSAGLLLNAGLWWWLTRHDEQSCPLPVVSALVVCNIGMCYLSMMIAAGIYNSCMSLIVLGVLAIGLLQFERQLMTRVFYVCLTITVLYDALVRWGVLSYAPVINPHAFEGVQPTWWWAVWRNTIFYMGWAVILGLLFMYFSRLDALHRQLATLSYTDVLTGLANRRYFMERLQAERERQSRSEAPYCLVLMDIDHFKSINDRYGHHAGDEVLKRLGAVLVGGLRAPTDQAARLGGEEFAALLPDTSLAAAQAVCQRIAQGLREHQFTVNGNPVRLTVSMGVIECRAESVEDLLKQADRNLYKAKQDGRDRAVCSVAAQEGMDAS